MSDSEPVFQQFARVQGEWAQLLAEALVCAGVREVAISPGSRSTPLVLALTEQDGLQCVAISDERSAAFFALGQAKATGRASALLCTSGSAPGHYLPAVMEASASFVPLLVISANRPLEREHCAAPQTTDQRRLFGVHSRDYFEVGLAEEGDRCRRALVRTVGQAVVATQWPLAGPVQMDVRLRKPLEPEPRSTPKSDNDRFCTPRTFLPQVRMCSQGLEQLASRLGKAQRPLVVAGPGPLSAVRLRASVGALCRTGVPDAFEVTSQLRGCGAFETLPTWMQVAAFREAVRPDFLLQVGASPVSGGWEPWIESLVGESSPGRPAMEHWVMTDAGNPDPVSTANAVLIGDLGLGLEELAARVTENSVWHPWHRWLSQIDQAGREVIDRAAADGSSEGGVARVVTETLPKSGLLALGNSLAVRLADTFCSGAVAVGGSLVWHQRGLNGIDGIPSGVAGSLTSLAEHCPQKGVQPARQNGSLVAHLLIGDVSLLHDLGGLSALRSPECAQLSVVVIDNDGGRIFDRLPVAGLPLEESQTRFFSTPPRIQMENAARMFGLGFEEAQDGTHLRELLSQTADLQQARLIRVSAVPGREATEHRTLLADLAAALPEAPGK